MYNNYYPNYNNPYDNQQQMYFNFVKEAVESGIKTMRDRPDDRIFEVWFDYSRKVLEMCAREDMQLMQMLNSYLSLYLLLNNQNIEPYEKISRCIDHLMNIMQYLAQPYRR